jgi:hypothetical protein
MNCAPLHIYVTINKEFYNAVWVIFSANSAYCLLNIL